MDNINYPLQEKIRAVVNGEADPETISALQQLIRDNPDAADELHFSKSLATALQHPDMVAAGIVIRDVIDSEGFPPPASGFSSSRWWKPGLWAGALLLCGLIATVAILNNRQAFSPGHEQQLSRQWLEPMENVLFVPQNQPGLEALQNGMAAYDAADFKRASQQLELYLAIQPDHPARIYLGIAQLLNRDAGNAANTLAAATRSPEPPVVEAAYWYLALAWLEQGNPEAARESLQQIPAGSDYAERAAGLLKQIK